jgi:hypothetical protein
MDHRGQWCSRRWVQKRPKPNSHHYQMSCPDKFGFCHQPLCIFSSPSSLPPTNWTAVRNLETSVARWLGTGRRWRSWCLGEFACFCFFAMCHVVWWQIRTSEGGMLISVACFDSDGSWDALLSLMTLYNPERWLCRGSYRWSWINWKSKPCRLL